MFYFSVDECALTCWMSFCAISFDVTALDVVLHVVNLRCTFEIFLLSQDNFENLGNYPQKKVLSFRTFQLVFEFFVRLLCNLRSKTFAFRLSQVDLNLGSTSR